MASSSTLPPPPGAGGSTDTQSGPSTPVSPSPAPEQDGTGGTLTSQMITVVNGLRTIAKAVPLASPAIQQINEIISAKVMPAIMQSQSTGEPVAPPQGG